MTVAEIKEYIDEKLKRYDCKGQGYFTPIDDVNKILFDIKSMLDELEPKGLTTEDFNKAIISDELKSECEKAGQMLKLNDEWVSVVKKLPSEKDIVICVDKDNDYYLAFYDYQDKHFICYDDNTTRLSKVCAWKSFEPFKSKE